MFERLEFTKRRNGVGAWTLEIDLNQACEEIKCSYQTQQYGIEILRNGTRYFTGPITRIRRAFDGNGRTLTLAGTDDNIYLTWRICMPPPYYATTSFSMAYDSRSGAAERVMKNYVDMNMGPNCPATARQIPNLTIEPTQDRGETVYYVARFDPLPKVLNDLILHIPGYNYAIEQVNIGGVEQLQFRLKPWRNQWANAKVVFSPKNGNLLSYDYTYEIPDYNFVLVGGGRTTGNETNPLYRQFAYSGNEYSRAKWGTIETFVDKRGTTNTNELAQAAWDALRLENGKEDPEKNMSGKINVVAEITETEGGPKLITDFDLGDYVRVVLLEDGQNVIEVVDYIKEITVELTPQNGETLKAVVGSNDSVETRGFIPFITDSIERIKERLQILEGGY